MAQTAQDILSTALDQCNTLGVNDIDIPRLLPDLIDQRSIQRQLANPLPLPTAVSESDMVAIKAFLLDGQSAAASTVYTQARAYLEILDQARFMGAICLLFKAVRAQMPSSVETDALALARSLQGGA